MAIRQLDVASVAEHAIRALKLDPLNYTLQDATVMAALIRRLVSTTGPCTRSAIFKRLESCLAPIMSDLDGLASAIEDAIEALVVGSDLVEIPEVPSLAVGCHGPFLVLAPSRFIRRKSGAIYVLGGAPDGQELLPQALASQVEADGYHRVISNPPASLAYELKSYGLHELSESVWLQSPKDVNPEDLVNEHVNQLLNVAEIHSTTSVRILDHSQNGLPYNQRWKEPNNQTGFFIARRPQEFGSPIWCFVQLEHGHVNRLLDLPRRRWPWRPCDAGWYLQLAIDRNANCPQFYEVEEGASEASVSFFSPMPAWARRRLMVIGRPRNRRNALFAYEIPRNELATEEEFLRDRLWLSRTN